MTSVNESVDAKLSAAELAKRNDLRSRKPYVAEKLARISELEERGEVSPIIRLEKSYLCNFQCTHCSAAFYMDRHLDKMGVVDSRPKMNYDDIRELSRQADEMGLARFVITGGEPLVMKDFDEVVAAIDPEKHYVISDTNGWFLDEKKARHIKDIGVEKIQISIDSFNEAEHDAFRNKPGSYKRAMRGIYASLEAGLNIIVQTVLVKGRVQTEEFRKFCEFCTEHHIGLYVSYAKPTGSCTEHPEFVIDKEEADYLRELEKSYNVFTHMTPSYGSFKGCITVKGIVTVTSTMELTPCPYIDFSFGNLRETPLKEILARGMRNAWTGPYRPDCLIGEDPQFIKLHMEKTAGVDVLPLPWGQGFSDDDRLPEEPAEGTSSQPADGSGSTLFDGYGRCRPDGTPGAFDKSRRRFVCHQPKIDYEAIHRRITSRLGGGGELSVSEFERRAKAILQSIEADPATKGILSAVHVPFFLPRIETAGTTDMGTLIESRFLPAVADEFQASFPQYSFANHHKIGLAGNLSTIEGSRHDHLLNSLATGPVVGCYFVSMTEYALPAALERVSRLPSQFLLAGGVDSCAAMIAAPDLLMRTEGYPPLLWMAALAGESSGVAYHFEAYGQNLTFNRRVHFNKPAESWSSGLVVLG